MKNRQSQPFHFKQFSIMQEKSAMKIGTDGVLLGAWVDLQNTTSIIDVGTGTGLIALQCAQRHSSATICAVDIDKAAIQEAEENFANSTWTTRLTAIHADIAEFKPKKRADTIVCNPPFYKACGLEKTTARRKAREQITLTLSTLAEFTNRYTSSNGRISLIYPYKQRRELITEFSKHNLHLERCCTVYGRMNHQAVRVLTSFSKQKNECIYSQLVIEQDRRHVYTPEYIQLTKEFYVNF